MWYYYQLSMNDSPGGETVQMRFQYHEEAEDRDQQIICFVWCNDQMKKTPPLKIARKPSRRPHVDDLLQQLVRKITFKVTKLATLRNKCFECTRNSLSPIIRTVFNLRPRV